MRVAGLIFLLIALIGSLIAVHLWWNTIPDKPERVEVPSNKYLTTKATLELGRVVEFHTNKGVISFVLYEKDCPNTTKRIADLVSRGKYDGVKWVRQEGCIIQTGPCKEKVKPMPPEYLLGLKHETGSVGMARIPADPNSATSDLYIISEPQPHLDMEYTTFGRVIKGLDVVLKIRKGDIIEKAVIRRHNNTDVELHKKLLKIDAEREVNP